MSVLGVFGGSFNPPHFGHQSICSQALASGEVDRLIVVPTFSHAFGKALASFEDRVEMCRLMTEPFESQAEISRIESERGGKSRTYDTLLALSLRENAPPMRLLVGADILGETHLWHRWDDLCVLAPPLVFKRAGYEGGQLPAPPLVSSSDIRTRLKKGEDADGLAPASVLRYIRSRGMYS